MKMPTKPWTAIIGTERILCGECRGVKFTATMENHVVLMCCKCSTKTIIAQAAINIPEEE